MAPNLAITDPVAPVRRPNASAADFGAGEGRALQQHGRQVSATAAVMDAAMDQRARFKATQYRAALNDAAQEILDDPNIEGREDRLERSRRALSQQYRGGNTGTFDREASVFESQIGARFRHQTRLHAIEQGQSDLSDNLQSLSDEWARLDGDPDAQNEVLERANSAVDGARESGLIDDVLADESFRRFQRNGARGRFVRMLREDPEAAAVMMSKPLEGFDEAERQELLTRALSAHGAVLRAERQAEKDRIQAERELEKERARDIEREFIQKEADGTLTIADVTASVDFLDPSIGRLWADRVRSGTGGGGSAGSVDRGLHLSLQNAVASGDPEADDKVRAAYRAGSISKTIYDELIDDDQMSRFGAARKFLTNSLDTGEIILDGAAAGPLMARRAQAFREFDLWKKQNPEATRDDSMRMADRLARAAQFFDHTGSAAFNLQPTFLVGDQMAPDFQATEDAIVDGLESGILSEDEAALEIRLLENLRRINGASAQVQGQ